MAKPARSKPRKNTDDLLKKRINEVIDLERAAADLVDKSEPKMDDEIGFRCGLLDADIRQTIKHTFKEGSEDYLFYNREMPRFKKLYERFIASGWKREWDGYDDSFSNIKVARLPLTAFIRNEVASAKALLTHAIKRRDEIIDLVPPEAPTPSKATPSQPKRRVFIVHGHDEAAREAVARFMERIDFDVIILHERANQGQTVIEKFEANSDVGFAIILLTPDDIGGKDGSNLRARARQNVVLELGYFIGRLGRKRVMALRKGELEFPSDILGVVAELIDEHGAWKQRLANELANAGFEIDWNKAMR